MSVPKSLHASLLLLAFSAGGTDACADGGLSSEGQTVYEGSDTALGSPSRQVVAVPDTYVVGPPVGVGHFHHCHDGYTNYWGEPIGTATRVWESLSNGADRIGKWLLLKDRKIKRQTYYPRISPECQPNYGYHATQWRRGFGYDYIHEGEIIPLPAEGAPVYHEGHPGVPVIPPEPLEPIEPPNPMGASTSRPMNSAPALVPHQRVLTISGEQAADGSTSAGRPHLPVESRVLRSPDRRAVAADPHLRTTGWRPTNPDRIRQLATSSDQ